MEEFVDKARLHEIGIHTRLVLRIRRNLISEYWISTRITIIDYNIKRF